MNEIEDLDRATADYLLDPAAAPAAEIARLEHDLAAFRYAPRPLILPARRGRGAAIRWALAAVLTLCFGASAVLAWRFSWPEHGAWRLVTSGTGETRALGRGEAIEVDAAAAASLRIARLGTMQVGRGTRLRLLETRTGRHRVAIDEGSVAVSVWAPPMQVGVATPAGWVYDMGCAFRLDVRAGVTAVEVTNGWVQLENSRGDALVPEGAASEMEAGRRPRVPLFRDAPPAFRAATRRFEDAPSSRELEALIAGARRRRDALTLLLLADRYDAQRAPLLARAAQLVPPSPARFARAAAGDRSAIWEWIDLLELPGPKSWISNWRDGFR